MKANCKPGIRRLILALIVPVFAAACGKKNIKQAAVPEPAQIGSDAVLLDTGEEDGEKEGSLRNKEYTADPALLTVNFDFDKAELSGNMRRILQENAAVLKNRGGVEIQAAGYCDEKGTTEYNLALGQRRANIVRDYYKYLGIRIKRMSTISYGEEKPACPESTEECWAQNRRVETLLKTR